MANSTYCHCDVIDATMDEDPLMSEKNGDFEYQKDFESLESRCDSSTNRYPCLRLLVSFGTLILCLNLIVVLSMYPMLRAWSIDATCPNPSLSLDGGFAPEFGLKEMYFEDDIEDYKAAAEQEGDKAWEDRFGFGVPLDLGYYLIPHPRKFGLPASRPFLNATQGEEIFVASMGHQLHCIGVLRKALLSSEGRQSGAHIWHCLEKLREGVLCAGDITPEAGTFDVVKDKWVFNDWRQPHTCRDLDSIRAWMHDHKAYG